MLLSALVLIAVNCEHDRLQERVNLRYRNETTQVGDMPRFRLQKKQQIAVFLSLLIIGEESFLQFGGVVQVAGNLVLL